MQKEVDLTILSHYLQLYIDIGDGQIISVKTQKSVH